MHKKLLKYTLCSIFLFLTLFGITEVRAEQYTGQAIWPSEVIPNIYISKYRNDGYMRYQQARFIRRSEDNKFLYCLQPYTDIDNNLPYYNIARQDFADVLNMTEEQWDRISLLAYYGYQYNQNGYNHSAQKWYAITQVLIWRTAVPTSRIVFTDTLNGTENPNLFASEIAEIESLVSNHYKRPNFNLNDLVLPLGQSITLTDTNGVLNQYSISSTQNVNATKDGNNLTLTATGLGEAKVNFVKNANMHSSPPIVYFSNHSQNVFRVGNYDPVPANFGLRVIGGRVSIDKLDSENHNSIPQGDATLSGAIYGIYNTSNDKISEITTDSSGYAISDYLPSLGEFYLKEIIASKGYTLDPNKYYFTLDENNLLINVDVYEKVVEKNLTIFKVYANGGTGILTPEPNVSFDIYLKSNNSLFTTITTDQNGYATVKLPYGTWRFSQKDSTPNFEKVNDFELSITENADENIYKLISNAEITAKLKVIKIDKDTKEVINRSGIKFKIKSLKTNDYVCQTITYPNASTICEYKTDENGVLITPYPLMSGRYVLEEVDQVIDGYLWNNESVEFEIGENSEFITDEEFGILFEVKFENKKVVGSITIYKSGEDFSINENGYTYEKINLSGVKYGLYNENHELINELVTGHDCFVTLDNIPLGKYYLKELESVNNNVIDDTVYEFELKYKDQYTPVIIKTFNFQNKYAKGTLELTKINSLDKPLSDVVFELYLVNGVEEEQLLGEYKTDTDGKIVLNDLPVIPNTKFYFVEKETREGFILNEEKHFFEFNNDGDLVEKSLINEKIKSRVIIHKIDEEGNSLSDIEIGIYDINDNLVFSDITNELGIIETELEYGKYYYKEIKAKEGLILDLEKYDFEVKNNDEVLEFDLINEYEEIEVPNTLSNDYTILIPIFILGIGLTLIVISEIKTIKKKGENNE